MEAGKDVRNIIYILLGILSDKWFTKNFQNTNTTSIDILEH